MNLPILLRAKNGIEKEYSQSIVNKEALAMTKLQYLQQHLFKTALQEHGIDCEFSCNQRYVGVLRLGISDGLQLKMGCAIKDQANLCDYVSGGFVACGRAAGCLLTQDECLP